MSHITTVEGTMTIPRSELPFIAQAIKEFCPDLEIVKNESHYRTWKDNHGGNLVGDWPLPDGWTAEQVGENAAHVIRVTDKYLEKRNLKRSDSNAPYEIGIVPVKVTRNQDGDVVSAVPDKSADEFVLMTDWYSNGNGILDCQGVGRREMAQHPQTGKKVEMSFGDLYMHYRMMQTKFEAERNGDTVRFNKEKDGTYTAVVETNSRIQLQKK